MPTDKERFDLERKRQKTGNEKLQIFDGAMCLLACGTASGRQPTKRAIRRLLRRPSTLKAAVLVLSSMAEFARRFNSSKSV